MNTKIFEAALAGLLYELQQKEGRIISDIVPKSWNLQIESDRMKKVTELVSSSTDSFSLKSMQPIFQAITLKDGYPAPPKQSYSWQALELTSTKKSIFPQPVDTVTHNWRDVWQPFKQNAQQLKNAHSSSEYKHVYLESLLNLLQRYFWAVPSQFYKTPNVSIYNHSRILAAIAACLANQDTVPNPESNEEVALLIGGDISGVQKFIYTLSTDKANSTLRGRSMYLQLLTEVLTRYLLDKLQLPYTNVIYAGGGHLFLLAPFDVNIVSQLEEIKQDISERLLQYHQGDLYLALAHTSIRANEFQGKPFSERWKTLSQTLQQTKERKFSELKPTTFFDLFQPQEHGGNEENQCKVCRRESTNIKDEKCPLCRSFDELGKDLREANYLCLDKIDTTNKTDSWQSILEQFGYHLDISQNKPRSMKSEKSSQRILLALNDRTAAQLNNVARRQSLSRHFLVNGTPLVETVAEFDKFPKKLVPIDKSKHKDPKSYEAAFKRKEKEIRNGILDGDYPIKTFTMMAQQSQGISRLGILRMDVDNLGKIFSKGLGDQANLPRVASLSFTMKLFFEGWVEKITEELNQQFKRKFATYETGQRIYSIYSGGDDLFFVGSWDVMPLLANRIQQDLFEYSGEHPEIHLSGGIALVPHKYPLYQAAEDAGDAEEKAKGRTIEKKDETPKSNSSDKDDPCEDVDPLLTKNALNFLGQTVAWSTPIESEMAFKDVQEIQEQMRNLIDPKGNTKAVPRSLLHRIGQLHAEYRKMNDQRDREGQEKTYWGPWHWHNAYSLTRLGDMMKRRNISARQAIFDIRDKLSRNDFTNIEFIALSARWAELLLRKGSDE